AFGFAGDLVAFAGFAFGFGFGLAAAGFALAFAGFAAGLAFAFAGFAFAFAFALVFACFRTFAMAPPLRSTRWQRCYYARMRNHLLLLCLLAVVTAGCSGSISEDPARPDG